MIECALAHTDAASLAEAIQSGDVQPRVHVEKGPVFGMPLQCRHCEDAPCLSICPSDAIHRVSEGGPVLLDRDRCIGCKFCMIVCPFGVIDLSRDGKAAVKCDLCIERTEAGEEPACVAACPVHGLKLRDLEEWLAERRQKAAENITTGALQVHAAGAEDSDGSDKG
jgi:carbon-monoxide dehydrogenase iron sulfur subunit